MNRGHIVKGLTNPAVILSVFRGLAALALIPLVLDDRWLVAAALLALAGLSDVMDGTLAGMYRHPWNGVGMNDAPSGLLAVLAPTSVVAWLFMNHPDAASWTESPWFWRWVGIGAAFVLLTFVLNSWKSSKRLAGKSGDAYRRTVDNIVRATVVQGWLQGVILVSVGVHYLHMLGADRFLWTLVVVWIAFVAWLAKHRWTDRLEVRIKYAPPAVPSEV